MTFRSGLEHKKGGAKRYLIFLHSLKTFDTEGGHLHPGTNQITYVSNSHYINTVCTSLGNGRVAHLFSTLLLYYKASQCSLYQKCVVPSGVSLHFTVE